MEGSNGVAEVRVETSSFVKKMSEPKSECRVEMQKMNVETSSIILEGSNDVSVSIALTNIVILARSAVEDDIVLLEVGKFERRETSSILEGSNGEAKSRVSEGIIIVLEERWSRES
jgi:hypothetical protein